jgi:hypothetical protein
MEADALRDYHTKLQNARDEINKIVCENWDKIRDEQLLTRSILMRLRYFYKTMRCHNKKLGVERMDTSPGAYFEELMHTSLSSFLNCRARAKSQNPPPNEIVSIHRDIKLSPWKINQMADIAVILHPKYDKGDLVGGDPVYIIECKTALDPEGFKKTTSNQQEAKKVGLNYECVLTNRREYREKDLNTQAEQARQKPNQWLYVLTKGWLGERAHEEAACSYVKEDEIKVQDAVETLYESILNICKL